MELVGEVRIGNTPYRFWNDGNIYTVNGQLLGKYAPHKDSSGNWDGSYDLWDTHGNLYANLKNFSQDSATITFTDGSSAQVMWSYNPNFSGTWETSSADQGSSAPQESSATQSSAQPPTQDQTLTTVTIGGYNYVIGQDYSVWLNGQQVGYLKEGEDGYDVYSNDGTFYGTLQSNGLFKLPDGSTQTYTHTPINTPSEVVAQISVYNSQTHQMDHYTLNSDGSVHSADGTLIGTYQTNSDGTYSLYDTDNKPWGTLNQNGTLTLANGQTTHVGFSETGVSFPYNSDTTQTTSTTEGTTTTGTTNTAQSQQFTSGPNESSQIWQSLAPGFIQQAQNLGNLAATAGTQAQEAYKNVLNQLTGPGSFQGVLNSLAKRGTLEGTTVSNALANAAVQQAQAIANQAFQASLANTQAQMQVPTQLASYLGSLAGQAGSSTGTQAGTTTQVGATSQTGRTRVHDPYRRPTHLLSVLK